MQPPIHMHFLAMVRLVIRCLLLHAEFCANVSRFTMAVNTFCCSLFVPFSILPENAVLFGNQAGQIIPCL